MLNHLRLRHLRQRRTVLDEQYHVIDCSSDPSKDFKFSTNLHRRCPPLAEVDCFYQQSGGGSWGGSNCQLKRRLTFLLKPCLHIGIIQDHPKAREHHQMVGNKAYIPKVDSGRNRKKEI